MFPGNIFQDFFSSVEDANLIMSLKVTADERLAVELSNGTETFELKSPGNDTAMCIKDVSESNFQYAKCFFRFRTPRNFARKMDFPCRDYYNAIGNRNIYGGSIRV